MPKEICSKLGLVEKKIQPRASYIEEEKKQHDDQQSGRLEKEQGQQSEQRSTQATLVGVDKLDKEATEPSKSSSQVSRKSEDLFDDEADESCIEDSQETKKMSSIASIMNSQKQMNTKFVTSIGAQQPLKMMPISQKVQVFSQDEIQKIANALTQQINTIAGQMF